MATLADDVLTEYRVGDIVTFAGYSDTSVDPIYNVGDRIRIVAILNDGGYQTVPEDGSSDGDTVFPDEIEGLVEDALPEAEEAITPEPEIAPQPEPEVTTKAKKPRKTKAKAETAPEPEVAQAAEPAPTTAIQAEGDNNEVIQIEDSARVSAILAEQDALEAAMALRVQAEENYLTLGGVLAHIYYDNIFKQAGFAGKRGFADYVEQKLGMAYRKAMYLIDIYVWSRKVGLDEADLAMAGWSKVKELTKIDNAEQARELVEFANENSREALQEKIQETVVDEETGAAKVRKIKFNFSLFADQAEGANRAIEAAKEIIGTDDVNLAFEHICTEWSIQNEGITVPLEDEIRRIEAKFGVRLAPVEDTASTDA